MCLWAPPGEQAAVLLSGRLLEEVQALGAAGERQRTAGDVIVMSL